MNWIMRKIKNRIMASRFLTGWVAELSRQARQSSICPTGQLEFIQQKIAPLKIEVDPRAQKRVSILIPEINFQTFYGGYIGKFNLVKKLLDEGYPVRVLIVDWCPIDFDGWQSRIFDNYDELKDILSRAEIEYCFDRSKPVHMNPEDTLIATTWWTAHIANRALQAINKTRFLYLIQEYEPFTFAMGTYYALAHQSYGFPHFPLFSTRFLHDFFKLYRIGIYADNRSQAAESAHFENAIFRFEIDRDRMSGSKEKKLLFYARPEPHAMRNMYEIGFAALSEAVKKGYFDSSWKFYGIGSTMTGDIPLPSGKNLTMIGKVDLSAYRRIMPEYDVGLALMYTPHPSLLPLEMAAAGQVVVTNSCMNKTRDQMEALSENIICAEPTIADVADSLGLAARRSWDIESRISGAQVRWAFSWDKAFNEKVMEKVKRFINSE